MAFTCNLKHIQNTGTSCKPVLSGIADTLFLFLLEDWKTALGEAKIPIPESSKITMSDIESLEGILYAVDIAEGTCEVKYTRGEKKKTVSAIVSFRVEENVLEYADNCATMSFRNFGVLAHQPGLGWHVLYSPYDCKAYISNESTSGQGWDADHGITSTITIAPIAFDQMVIPEDEVTVDFKDWKKPATSGAVTATTCTINVLSVAGGSIKVEVAEPTDSGYGDFNEVSSGDKKKYNSQIRVTATPTPDSGKACKEITVNGTIVDRGNEWVGILNKDITIGAKFA